MSEIIHFDGSRKRYATKPAAPQVTGSAANRGRFADNQFTRRACIRMLLCGSTFRAVAKKHPGREEGLTQDVREAILGGMAV